MPFYRINQPGQPRLIAHLNFGRRVPRACVFPDVDVPTERCARVGEALCDGPAGEDLSGQALTCDAPMCRHHRTTTGPDTDLCPRCVRKRDAH